MRKSIRDLRELLEKLSTRVVVDLLSDKIYAVPYEEFENIEKDDLIVLLFMQQAQIKEHQI